MKIGRSGSGTVLGVSIALLVLSILGFVGGLLVNAFLLDKYDAYGEVAVPGSGTLHLPAGEVTVSFHTRIIGSTGGLGLPVPELQLGIVPPPGVADPAAIESIGTTTTVNNDARIRVWVLHVVTEGDYEITADGKVSAFIGPRLAFGYRSSAGRWIWGFAALFVVGLVGIVVSVVGKARAVRDSWGALAVPSDAEDVPDPGLAESTVPSDERIRLEQLKTIAALRDSGALTDAEFEAEKRRILHGH